MALRMGAKKGDAALRPMLSPKVKPQNNERLKLFDRTFPQTLRIFLG